MKINQNMPLELACLYYEVRDRFYKIDTETYLNACLEVSSMATQLNTTLNELAKMLVSPLNFSTTQKNT